MMRVLVQEVSPVSNLMINANRTQGYLLSEESLMSAELLVDLRPQAECARVGWAQISGIAKQTLQFCAARPASGRRRYHRHTAVRTQRCL